MDYLYGVKKKEQVYSQELNEVLIKTPSVLFKIGLWYFCVISILFLALSYFIELNDKIEFQYVLVTNKENKTAIVCILPDNLKIENLDPGFKLLSNSGQTSKMLYLHPSNFKKIWYNSTNILYPNQLTPENLINLNSYNEGYHCQIPLSSADQISIDEYITGKIQFQTKKMKLYQTFLSQ